MRWFQALAFAVWASVTGLAPTTVAQDKPGKGPVFVDPLHVDADFGFQGEYTGDIEVGMAGLKPLALQVVAWERAGSTRGFWWRDCREPVGTSSD